MADNQHEGSRYVAATIARNVGRHPSSISRFENKNQARSDVKDLPWSKRPPITSDLAGSCKGHACTVSEICIPQSQTYTCVLLLEVFVQWRTRKASLVSQNKGTGQSTPFDCHNVVVCKPGAGVDGIKEFNNMFHTNTEREPFWWVNLGQVYKIQKVVSTNRIHCCGDRLTKMLIHVGTSLDTSQMELCGQFIGPAVTGQVIVILCNTLPEGQVVKLTSVNTASEVFHLAEVEVYAV
ncbi:fucolectin-1-like [Mytilus trossulus]|uniref:fucolectin-1-like n=1 Tax=Mytilus trossulus TaxID=6551 RepID=UPI003006874F